MIGLKKRHFLILEVLIAFTLIVLCVFPLLIPQAFILKSQGAFIKKIKLDHFVNLLYGNITERLYLNSIEWKDIESGTLFPITADTVAEMGFPPLFSQGSYSFKESDRKPSKSKDKPDPPYILYILTLTFSFKINEGDEKALEYTYDIFVARNLEGASPVSES